MSFGTSYMIGVVDYGTSEPTVAVEYAIRDVNGEYYAYGDQSWVACGEALFHHPGGVIVRRVNTISYGSWEQIAPEDPAKTLASEMARRTP